MFEGGSGGAGRSVLMWTVKMAAIVAVLSFAATRWLAGPALESGPLARLADLAASRSGNPITTGSIAGGPISSLDPCTVPQRAWSSRERKGVPASLAD